MSAGRIVNSGDYRFDPVGVVRVRLRANATRIVARWREGMLHATVPRGIEYSALQKFLAEFAPRIQQLRPVSPYYDGQVISFPEIEISISRQSHVPTKIIMSFHHGEGFIEVGDDWDIKASDTIRQITKLICRMAQSKAPDVLLPQAHQVAREIGKAPLAWKISNGHRVLGHCNMKGEIALSYALLFYPAHLRRYVICHELAHLTEMNHSPNFHKICDEYCDGQEAQLISELKKYKVEIPL